jgi:hypothetical protein
MAQNLVLSETELADFKRYCKGKGFDLSYFSPEISGSKEEIEHYPFSSPKIIELRKCRLGFKGIPYDVAEWQQEKWVNNFSGIQKEFSKRGR